MQVTTTEIIANRKKQIFNRSQEIRQRIYDLEAEKESLIREEAYLMAEHDMLERIDMKGLIVDTVKRTQDRVMIEDAVREIFDEYGRPVKIKELIDELEKYGFQWSTYANAYYRVKRLPYICETGAYGYVQFLRG